MFYFVTHVEILMYLQTPSKLQRSDAILKGIKQTYLGCKNKYSNGFFFKVAYFWLLHA